MLWKKVPGHVLECVGTLRYVRIASWKLETRVASCENETQVLRHCTSGAGYTPQCAETSCIFCMSPKTNLQTQTSAWTTPFRNTETAFSIRSERFRVSQKKNAEREREKAVSVGPSEGGKSEGVSLSEAFSMQVPQDPQHAGLWLGAASNETVLIWS